MKKLACVAAAIALGCAAFLPVQASAEVGLSIVVGNAPPPVPYEVVPPPRYGYVWIPGYWDWDGWQYVWNEGYWLPTRAGYFYDAPHWYQGSGGWYLQRGGWHAGERHARPDPRRGYGRSDWSHGQHRNGGDRRDHRGDHDNHDNHGNKGRGYGNRAQDHKAAPAHQPGGVEHRQELRSDRQPGGQPSGNQQRGNWQQGNEQRR